MSFVSILKKIVGVAATVEHTVAPIAEALVPIAAPEISMIDNMVQHIQAAVQKAELTSPVGNGQLKAQAVTADFESGLELFQAVLAARKEKLVYDTAELQAGLASQVAAYNSFAKVKDSFKIVPQ